MQLRVLIRHRFIYSILSLNILIGLLSAAPANGRRIAPRQRDHALPLMAERRQDRRALDNDTSTPTTTSHSTLTTPSNFAAPPAAPPAAKTTTSTTSSN